MTPQPWMIGDAVRLVGEWTPVVNEYGFLLAMYGSVARCGVGRDLDLLAVRWRPGRTPEELIAGLAVRFAVLTPTFDRGINAISSSLWLPANYLVDLQVRG